MKHPNLWLFMLGLCVMMAPLIGLMNFFQILDLADLPLPSIQILRTIVGATVFVSLGVGFSIMVIAINRIGRTPREERVNGDNSRRIE
ncbi:MAG TPA: hypothetical protein VGM98_03555 [Schlesneria sp.]|jgi:hypothetical protein